MSMRTMTGAAAVLVALTGAVGVPDVASAAVTRSRLTLTYAVGEAARPASRHATLTCQPAGGSHRRARAACTALSRAHGDITAIPPADRACAQIYAPVTVTATGRWQGRSVRFQHTYGNDCVLGVSTGPVFTF